MNSLGEADSIGLDSSIISGPYSSLMGTDEKMMQSDSYFDPTVEYLNVRQQQQQADEEGQSNWDNNNNNKQRMNEAKENDPTNNNCGLNTKKAQTTTAAKGKKVNNNNNSQKQSNDTALQEEIEEFYRAFPGLRSDYDIVKKIGEGTFSSVYKAIDLHHDSFRNKEWCEECKTGENHTGFVAVKRIYVTSSPSRVYHETNMLAKFDHPNIITLITADRHKDNVVVIFPYFRHNDFRSYHLKMTMNEVRTYMKALLSALEHVHQNHVVHRDVKPSNFLFDKHTGKGVLVDFGLSQFECDYGDFITKTFREKTEQIPPGYIAYDERPSVKANRAGTRGFRAPEVLFKVVRQTRAIDIWSVGVILLSILSGRFPFFNALDDMDALIELGQIYGYEAMEDVARQFGRTFQTNIDLIGDKLQWSELIEQFRIGNNEPVDKEAIDLMDKLLTLWPKDRISASEALKHPFFAQERQVEDEE